MWAVATNQAPNEGTIRLQMRGGNSMTGLTRIRAPHIHIETCLQCNLEMFGGFCNVSHLDIQTQVNTSRHYFGRSLHIYLLQNAATMVPAPQIEHPRGCVNNGVDIAYDIGWPVGHHQDPASHRSLRMRSFAIGRQVQLTAILVLGWISIEVSKRCHADICRWFQMFWCFTRHWCRQQWWWWRWWLSTRIP